MPLSNHTILLVEDNEDDVFLIRRALKQARIINPVHVAEDGGQAIDYLQGAGHYLDRIRFPFPRIMFLDLKLPIKSGFDVLMWMRLQTKLSPPVIVVLTSSNSPKDLARVTELGAALYEIKPPAGELFRKLTEAFQIDWQFAESGASGPA